jgi:hypothetical protein
MVTSNYPLEQGRVLCVCVCLFEFLYYPGITMSVLNIFDSFCNDSLRRIYPPPPSPPKKGSLPQMVSMSDSKNTLAYWG